MTQGPSRGSAATAGSAPQEVWPVAEGALDLQLQHSISAPPRCAAPGEESPFHEGPCVAFITAFIVCVHLCHGPFCEAVLLLLQCYSAVLNNCTPSCYIILACHSNGILSQLVTPYNILYLVCDFLKCFLSKVKICRRDSGLIIQSIYQERWRFFGGMCF